MKLDKQDKIAKILLEDWDPAGVRGMPGGENEYSTFALKIAGLLRSGKSVEEISNYLGQVVVDEFGLTPNYDLNLQVSKKICSLK